ncbi:MAG: beta-lactamase family protein [Verrucomicrobia bacterium]|nr:beta-lactamase family protein [Verrucomicrobiota bacterium]
MRCLAWLEQGVREGRHLGAQICVRHRGEWVIQAALGEARPGVPMRVDSSLFWFSSCKPVTAILILQLHEEGLLNLGDPVALHIPEFAQRGKEGVTILHLLTHTGGIRGSKPFPPELDWKDAVRYICELSLDEGTTPGKGAAYHPVTSWQILAEIVTRKRGMLFSSVVRERVFLPLGLADSWIGMEPVAFQSLGERNAGIFPMTPGQPLGAPYWDREEDSVASRPGGGGRGPTRELCLLMESLMRGAAGAGNGGRILQEGSARLLRQRHRQGMMDETFQCVIDWGLGVLLNTPRAPGMQLPYGLGAHASMSAFGHGGMQISMAFADPEHDLAVAWVCNGMCGERLHRERNHRVNTFIYEDLELGRGD